jgi:hypothetical protein
VADPSTKTGSDALSFYEDPRGIAIHSALRAYIERHPGACDTTQGIMTWWLKNQDTDEQLVEQVLGDMVRQGMIEHIRLAGDVVVYRVAGVADEA